jgi:TatD DNase family protein
LPVQLVDSHCHLDCLNLEAYDGDLAQALNFAKQQGVSHFLCVAITLEKFPDILAIAEQYPEVRVSVGLHPNERGESEPAVENLVRLAEHPCVVAIGETGLDYYRSEGDITWQQERFRTHIRAAKRSHKPLIIHTRAARDDTLRIMQEEQVESVGGVMHCFSEDLAMAEAAIALGFYISISGIITFKTATELQALVQALPLEHLLIETDSPYLAPIPFRGRPNQPGYVRYVAETIAHLKGISFEEVARVTTENYFKLFINRGVV